MSLPPLLELLGQCRRQHSALPAFNIDAFEIYQAVENAVAQTRLACIVQLSAGEDRFLQAERLFLLVQKARLEGLPIYLNMDHGQDLPRLEHLAALGFDMLHFDGSKMEYSDCETVTKNFVAKIRSINPDIIIEGEFNALSVDSQTSPVQAGEFVARTSIDLFAVSIGNIHGINQDVPEHLNLDLLTEIKKSLPQTFFTLHGGSGISPDQIKQAIGLGVVKININTDLRLQYRHSLRQALAEIDSQKVYDYLVPVITDLETVIKQKLIQFSAHV